MGISHTEKESWKKRIEQRFDREIGRICAEHEPGFQGRMDRDIMAATLSDLGISAQKAQIQELELQGVEIDRQRSLLDDQRQSIRRRVGTLHCEIAGILKLDPNNCGYGEEYKVSQRIDAQKQTVTRRLMASDPIGQQIVQLHQERDTLLDLVSLATTKAQFEQVWDRYQQLLQNGHRSGSGHNGQKAQ